MYETWASKQSDITYYILPEGNPYKKGDYPCSFFADYFRALKTKFDLRLVINAVDLAIDGDGADAIPYPNCLKPEFNPLVNFAIKMKPIFYHKNGKDIEYNCAIDILITYLHNAFINGADESNEPWMYEESLWFDEKGKQKDDSVIIRKIKSQAKYKEYILG